MAEVAAALGVASSIFTIYENCIKLYDTIQLGRSHGKDLGKLELKLQVEKWRLLAWGRSFGLDSSSAPQESRSRMFDQRLNDEPVRQMIEGIFCNIQDIFQDTNGLRKRYGLNICDENAIVQQQSGGLLPFKSVYRKHKGSITRRQKNASFSGTIRWAIGDYQKFSELVGDLHGWNNDLQNVTSSFQSFQTQRESLAFDVESVADEESLQAIAEVCSEDNSEIASIAQDRLRTLESASVRDSASVFSDGVNPINAGFITSCLHPEAKNTSIQDSGSMALSNTQQPSTSFQKTMRKSENTQSREDYDMRPQIEGPLGVEANLDLQAYPKYLCVASTASWESTYNHEIAWLRTHSSMLKQYPSYAYIMSPIPIDEGSPHVPALHALMRYAMQGRELVAYWTTCDCLPRPVTSAERAVESINAMRKAHLLIVAIAFQKSSLTGRLDLRTLMQRQLACASLIDYLDDQVLIEVYALDLDWRSANKVVESKPPADTAYSSRPLYYTKQSLKNFLNSAGLGVQSPTEIVADCMLDDSRSSSGHSNDGGIRANPDAPSSAKIDRWKLEQAYLDLGPKKRPPNLRRVRLKSEAEIGAKRESRILQSSSSAP